MLVLDDLPLRGEDGYVSLCASRSAESGVTRDTRVTARVNERVQLSCVKGFPPSSSQVPSYSTKVLNADLN